MKKMCGILASHDTLVKMGMIGDLGSDGVLDSQEFIPDGEGSKKCLAKSSWSLSSRNLGNGFAIQAPSGVDGASSTIEFMFQMPSTRAYSSAGAANTVLESKVMRSDIVVSDSLSHRDSVLVKSSAFRYR